MLYAEEVEVPDLGADEPKKPPFWRSGGFQWQGFVRPEAAPWGEFKRAYASPRESTCPSCVGTPVGLSGTEACQVMPLAASSRTGRWAEMTAKFGCPERVYPFWFWPKSPVTGSFGYGWFKYIPFIHGEQDMRARDAWSKAHPSDFMTPPFLEDFGTEMKPAAPAANPVDPAIQSTTAPVATVNVIPPPPTTSNLAKKAEEELLIQSTIDASKKKKEQQLVAALAIGAVALIWWTSKNKKRK
jgi:hypothetical protein